MELGLLNTPAEERGRVGCARCLRCLSDTKRLNVGEHGRSNCRQKKFAAGAKLGGRQPLSNQHRMLSCGQGCAAPQDVSGEVTAEVRASATLVSGNCTHTQVPSCSLLSARMLPP